MGIERWKEGTGWEIGPLDYMELEETGESLGLGEISDPFPDCSGGINACCGCG